MLLIGLAGLIPGDHYDGGDLGECEWSWAAKWRVKELGSDQELWEQTRFIEPNALRYMWAGAPIGHSVYKLEALD